MLELEMTLGLVRLKNDYYVVINPNWASKDLGNRINDETCIRKLELAAYNLWGEGVPFRTIKKTTEEYSITEDVKKFSKDLHTYIDSCKARQEKHYIYFAENEEKAMKEMGLPVCCSFGNKDLHEDVFIVMTVSDYERIVMPKIKKKMKLAGKNFGTKDFAYEFSKLICSCYKL
ncbi:MAG: hypothetical protein MJ246_06570 [Clostridia bacterium]|nr:hypothetical protein [Clostridia bacterium]